MGIYNTDKSTKFSVNILSIGVSNAIIRIFSFATFVYLPRVLQPAAFGAYAYALSIVAYASIFLLPGLTTWGTREVSQKRSNAGKILFTINSTQLALSIFAFAGTLIYSLLLLDNFKGVVVALCCLSIFNTALNLDWVFNGLELMYITSIFQVFTIGLNFFLILLTVRNPGDIYYVPIIGFGVNLSFNIYKYIFIRNRYIANFGIPGLSDFKYAWSSSILLTVYASFGVILHYTNNLIIEFYLGVESLGQFFSAYRVLELTSSIPALLLSAFLPRLSRISVEQPSRAIEEAKIFARYHVILAFFFGALFLVEGDSIVNLLFGQEYQQAGIILRIMSIAVVFNFIIIGYSNCLIAFHKDAVMVKITIVSAIVSVAGGLIIIPIYGIIGAAYVIALIDLSGFMLSAPYYKNVIGTLQLSKWLFPLGVGIISAALLYFLRLEGFGVCIRMPVMTMFYFLMFTSEIKELIGNAKES